MKCPVFDPLFRDHVEAFDNAIQTKRLSRDARRKDYAGNWMYMHTEPNGRDAFKNIISREYIYVENTNPI